MRANQADLSWLQDPEVFEVNRLQACSDHLFYKEEKDDVKQSLNGIWKLDLFENPGQRNEKFYTSEVNDQDWKDVHVPAELQCEGYLPHHYTNTIYPWDGIDHLRPPYISSEHNVVAQYRKHFDVLPERLNDKTILQFDGVETAFYVWLNGAFVGYSEDSFTPARFDVSGLLKEKGNVLGVEVYQRSSASWLEDQDMWRFMGIFRDVFLSFLPAMHIEDLKTIQEIDLKEHKAKLIVECTNILQADGSIEVTLFYKGKEIVKAIQQAADKNVFEFDVEDVHLWSAEYPELYDLHLVLKDNEKVIEQVDQSIGFRKVEIEDGILKLNGKRIVFHGINRHEFSSESGRTLGKDIMEFDAAFMKQNNINAVRTSHYPNQSYWYELADKYGIYLIDETNLETHGSWQKLGQVDPEWNIPGSKKEWLPAVLDRVKSMYERDKNHPSILIWSLGNEAYGGSDLVAMHDYFKEADPSRPVHYEGITWCREFETASDLESRMYAKPWEIEEYVKTNPKKPYISCEYEHAMGNSLGNMQEYMDLEKYPSYQGGFIWDYVDQAIAVKENGKTKYLYGGDFYDKPNDGNFCGDGVLFADRSETPKVQEMKQLYRYVDIDVDAFGAEIENKYLFDDLSDMYFVAEAKKDGKLLYTKEFEMQIEPGNKKSFALDWPKDEQEGVYTYTVTMHNKSSKKYLPEGHELAFGQKYAVHQNKNVSDKKIRTVQGDGNIGVYGQDFAVYFQYQKGLLSVSYQGKEMILPPVKPDFFRAFTDNDEGAGYLQSAGIWMAAGMFEKIIDVQADYNESKASITFTYQIPFVQEHCYVAYIVDGDGTIEVLLDLPANKNRPMLPCFGLRLQTPLDMDQLVYMGKGPKDTYMDRDHARMDVYTSCASKEDVPYLKPQEHGNHMQTWWLKIHNQNGEGFKIQALEQPFQFSFLQHSPEELQIASHQEELPAPYCNTLRILSAQMGVGGDDTWGAQVHDAYLLNNEENLKLRFIILPDFD
jgi:beta-galactosidase